MKKKSVAPWIVILFAVACVDRIDIKVDKPKSQAISIDGFISDQPGPYEIHIQNVFDVESKESTREPVSVKKLEISDNYGNHETMTEVNPGIYQTLANGIQGIVGRVYQIKIELYDGRVYESWPDTIKAPGKLDSMYYSFRDEVDILGDTKHYIDVQFDASYEVTSSTNYIWKFRGTFKADTRPDLYFQSHIGPAGNYTGLCFYLNEIGQCNLQPPCSGLRNIGTIRNPMFEMKFPCSCCTCWYNILNDELLLNNNDLITKGIIKGRLAKSIPINQWMFLYKLRLSIEQHTLTQNSLRFYRAIQDQKDAIGSLFQPITGVIPSNFNQLNGPMVRAEGLFYATALQTKVKYLTRFDLPTNLSILVPEKAPIFPDDCRYLYPGSTNIKPAFWID